MMIALFMGRSFRLAGIKNTCGGKNAHKCFWSLVNGYLLEVFDRIVWSADMTRPPNGNSAVWLGRCRNASSQGLAYAVLVLAVD
jgi:hypothetical protein